MGLCPLHIRLAPSKSLNKSTHALQQIIDNRDYAPGLETERRAHSYVDTLRVRRSVRICEPFLDP